MTPTPDTKGAQPEQLVAEARDIAEDLVQYGAPSDGDSTPTAPPYLVDVAIISLFSLATALSECRERERHLEEVRRAADDYMGNGFLTSRAGDRLRKALGAAQPPSEANERSGNG